MQLYVYPALLLASMATLWAFSIQQPPHQHTSPLTRSLRVAEQIEREALSTRSMPDTFPGP